MEAAMALIGYHTSDAGARGDSLKVFALVGLFMLAGPVLGASSNDIPDAAILQEFQAIYGISKQEAVDRIAQEAEARRIHHALRDHLGSAWAGDRKSTRLNSSHVAISYAVFCLKK